MATTIQKKGMSGSQNGKGTQDKNSSSQKSSLYSKEQTSATSRPSTTANAGKDTLDHLFENCLKHIYSAEQQLVEALPEMAKAADSEDLQNAINQHLQQTKKQVERLEKIFNRLQITPAGETCQLMKGLIEEGKKAMSEYQEGPVRDSALIIGAQKIEHHEIATYGSLCELADVLGHHKIMDILDRSLREEEDTDRMLTHIAEHVNDEACELSEYEYSEE